VPRLPVVTTTALAPLGAAALPSIHPGATLADQIAPLLGWFHAVRGRRENTIRAYELDLRGFVAFAESAGVVRPNRVTFNLLEMYFAHRQHRQGKKATTVNRTRYARGSFFKFLRRQGLVTHDPVADTYGLPEPQTIPKYLTIAEQERILEALAAKTKVTGRRNYAMIATALLCGLRVSELATVRVTDLDLEAGTLIVFGKGDKQRQCTVVPRLRVILADYLKRTWPKLVGGRDGAPYLFVRAGVPRVARRRGQAPLLTRSIWATLDKQVSPLVGKPVHPHMLRHSVASRLRENGAPLELIQEALGHVNIATTLIYAHVSTKKQRADIARYLEGLGK
jgi:integrase/recombinase XerD